ncbi:MAG TPA: MFS transporter [Cerasibacillus sp.]|uniref:MFS transporter n=1 Tax=Cerasibacillus sp. TaxID=2498711 RepID=UPI002F424DBA
MGEEQKAITSQTWAITLFTIAVFMSGLDNGIISTALTTISDSFHVSPSWGAWSVTIYTFGIAISVPIIGKLSDQYGRKRLFLTEITLFGIGSLLVALSPNFTFLLLSRFIQAIGGGGIFVIGTSYILATLPKEKQGKVLGIFGGMHGLSAVIGPNLGAVILQLTGKWQWMFLINIPIVIFLIVFGYIKIQETKSTQAGRLDIIGSILLGAGILAIMFGLTNIESELSVWPYLVLGTILFILLIRYEKYIEQKGNEPIIPTSLLKSQLFRITLFIGLLSGGFLAGIIFIPAYVQQVLQVPVEQAGYWLTPMALASGIGAGLGGVLTDKIGARQTLIIAGVIGLTGFVSFPIWVSGFISYLIASVFAGIGLGFLLGAPLNVLVGESAGQANKGTAIGTLSLVRQIGLTLFPTLYAGLLTKAYIRLEHVLETSYSGKLQLSDVGTENYSLLIEQVEQLIDPHLKSEILATISRTLELGFSSMFMVAACLAFITIFIGIYLTRKNV